MTIAPATIPEMLASTRFEELRAAIVAKLAALMKGVTVNEHPGKLDINDVLAKQIVAAPGIAIGWNRIRRMRDLGGTYGMPIDFVAFIVVEDYRDTSGGQERLRKREIVANAIGTQLLLILGDDDTASWGLTGLTPPWPDPEPEMRPIFTMKVAEQATGLFAVTWTQALLLQGRSYFDGPTPGVYADPADGPPEGLIFDNIDLDADDIPTEIRALMSREEVP